MEDLERSLLGKLDEVVKALVKQLADKNETKKALKNLEKQLRNLYDLVMNRPGGDEEDAMFAKKPLGGWSCASCEKNLVNIAGQTADFYPWGRFPVRDPGDRIAKLGQGFSRMLNMIKTDGVTRTHEDEIEGLPDSGPHHVSASKPPPRTMQNFFHSNEELPKAYGSAKVLPGLRRKKEGKH